ncbi:MAG: DNA recombination protein RmuC [Micavibrio aeruginosavorus]|uniref:DNA recombination protein RmuC n=1 Tax=Micavibrio aeruginosavorus TaxID=349221 RepID=A0A2W5HLZ6_9BACT|nr:MAG: DNA recombination protein RmuC [Micavibrio aeruginosavorus]
MTFDLISAIIGFSCGALAITAFLAPKLARSKRDEETLGATFEALAQESMRKSQEQFLNLAAEKLKQAQMEGSHDLEKRQTAIATLVDPIGKSLKEMEAKIETLGKTGAGLEMQLKNFADDQKNLSKHTQQLAQAMKNPVVRGQWGEMQLQRALEFVGMRNPEHYQTQVSVQGDNGVQRPDFVINLPTGVQIVIDVKTPLDPYLALIENSNEEMQEKNLATFRQSVRAHIKTLSAKNYSKQFNSPEFVVMFLPSEGLYSTAIGNDPELLNEASNNNIILASPTTVMGLLRVVMYGWQQQKIAQEANNISALASDLFDRMATFGNHMVKLGKNLGTAVNSYNDSVGSMERSVLSNMRKLKELHMSNKEIIAPSLIETMPRPITSQVLLNNEDTDIISLKASNE